MKIYNLLEKYPIDIWKISQLVPEGKVKYEIYSCECTEGLFNYAIDQFEFGKIKHPSPNFQIVISRRKERDRAYFIIQPNGAVIIPEDNGKFVEEISLGNILTEPIDKIVDNWKNLVNYANYKDNVRFAEIEQGLTWLHISDWHQEVSEFRPQLVRDALIRDIRNRSMIHPDLAKIDFIVFSGDVASSGQTEEYSAAISQLFTPLLEACGISSDHLFIVPGNHDLDRRNFASIPAKVIDYPKSAAEVQRWLSDKPRKKLLSNPFHAFADFVASYTGQKQPDYSNICKWEKGNKHIALLGLNSAWISGRHKDSKGKIDDLGFLIVGEPQISESLEKISDADVKILVLHHPFDWLAEFDRIQVENRLRNQCHFILCGHQHKPQIEIVCASNGCMVIPAGACYNRGNTDDTFYASAYNFVHLDFNAGKGVMFLRRWSDPRNEWIEDNDSFPSGKFEFSLPGREAIKEVRVKKIRAKLLELASKELIPDQILSSSLRIINQRLEQLSNVDRKRKELLENLSTGDLKLDIFLAMWYSIQDLNKSIANLKLAKVELEQIRCFKELSVSFQERGKHRARQWTMVLGDNAAGKTTLLRSIAIGLCNESDGTTLMRKLPGEFVRKGARKGTIKLTLWDEVGRKEYTITTTIERTLDSESEILRKTTDPADEFPWKDIFVCGYGTHRTSMANASYDGYSTLNSLSTLFDSMASLQNPEVVLLKARDRCDILSEALLSVLMLDESDSAITLPKNAQKSMEIVGPWGKQPLASLSDGYLSTSQWLLDFLGWAIYAERFDVDNVVGGILLIDELEQHLHPKWQRYIVQRLAKKLPQTQIISTTHTPLVAAAVGDIPSSSILKLSHFPERQTIIGQLIKPAEFRGKRADQILAELFNLATSRSVGGQNDIERYVELSAKNRNKKEDRELQKLSERLQEIIVFGENTYEQDVERAVRKTLEERLKSPPDQLLSLEIKRQLRELFREEP